LQDAGVDDDEEAVVVRRRAGVAAVPIQQAGQGEIGVPFRRSSVRTEPGDIRSRARRPVASQKMLAP
jgi:hypothetical protein